MRKIENSFLDSSDWTDSNEDLLYKQAGSMTVTPREVDLMTERASKLTALAINCALQPDISPEDMLMLTS